MKQLFKILILMTTLSCSYFSSNAQVKGGGNPSVASKFSELQKDNEFATLLATETKTSSVGRGAKFEVNEENSTLFTNKNNRVGVSKSEKMKGEEYELFIIDLPNGKSIVNAKMNGKSKSLIIEGNKESVLNETDKSNATNQNNVQYRKNNTGGSGSEVGSKILSCAITSTVGTGISCSTENFSSCVEQNTINGKVKFGKVLWCIGKICSSQVAVEFTKCLLFGNQ